MSKPPPAMPLSARLRYFVTRLEELRELSRAAFPSPPQALGPIEDVMLEGAAEIERQREEIAQLQAENAELRQRLTVDDAMAERHARCVRDVARYAKRIPIIIIMFVAMMLIIIVLHQFWLGVLLAVILTIYSNPRR